MSSGMTPTTVKLTSPQNVDLVGRIRVANPITKFANKNIHNRNKNQWEEPIVGAIITYENLLNGPFQVSEIITGGTSNTIGTVTAVDGGSVTITYLVNHDDFQIGEEITGGTSTATADILTVKTGSTITHNRDIGGVILQVGTGAADSAARVTHRYIPYIPFKVQFISNTFLFGEATENLERWSGYGYTDDRIALKQDFTGLYIVLTSKVTGSLVTTLIHQNDPSLSTDGISTWNINKFDGSDPHKLVLDVTKEIFLYITFVWQGSGPLVIGLIVDGNIMPMHKFKFFGEQPTPFISTPSLPVFYQINNTDITSSTNTMNEYCTSVISESGEKLTGIGFTVSNGIVSRAVGVGAEVPILAVRLKNSFGDGANRRTLQFSNGSLFATTNNAHFHIKHVHDPTDITGDWTDVGGGSAAEFSINISTVIGNPAHEIEEGYVPAGGAPGKGGAENVVEGDKLDQHRFVTQNIDSTNSEMFVISAIALTGTSNVYAHMSWVEFE